MICRRPLLWLLWIRLAFLLALSAPAFSAPIKVDFRISKIHGFYDFLGTISGGAHHSKLILEAFQGSAYNTPENQKLFDQIRNARESMTGFNFEGFPKSRSAGSDVGQLFSIQSIFAKDLDDLSSRTLGLIPIAEHTNFFNAAKKLLPVYEKLIWIPSETKLKKFKTELMKISTEAKLDRLFSKASRFYGAEWPKDQPFVIGLYPTPGKKGATSSSSLGAAESVGILLAASDPVDTFGILFHELCHSLYKAQSVDFQSKLENMFFSQKSLYAYHAYNLLNEGLATALGNGWAEKAASGKLNSHSWYNDPFINGFSKAIYPLVVEYVEKDKTIDEDFVKKSIAMLESQMPESLYSYDNLFQWVVVVADGNVVQGPTAHRALQGLFRNSRWSSHDPINSGSALSDASRNHHTLLVIFEKSEKNQLDALAEKIPLIKNNLKAFKEKNENFVFSSLDPRGRAIVVIQVSTAEDVRKAFEFLKTTAKIDPKNSFQYF